MSRYELVSGKLELLTEEVTEDYAQKVINDDLPVWCESYLEMLSDDPEYYDHICIKDKWYKIQEISRSDEFCDYTEDKEGNITFETHFDNGGTCWERMVSAELYKR